MSKPAPTVLVFDSGLGGLTVFRELTKARPDAHYVYLADDARFPYGEIPERELVARIIAVIGDALVAYNPDIVTIACNTAAATALKELRAAFAVPFIGTVPAIKPACAQSKSKLVSVLGTRGAVSREYTHALIREFAQGCEVKLVGSAHLAGYAEAELHGAPASDVQVTAEIAPCFVEQNGARTDTVVLACTHYPLLLERLKKLAPWPVAWIDPAPAIARRLTELLGPPGATLPVAARIRFTSGRELSAGLARALRAYGFSPQIAENA